MNPDTLFGYSDILATEAKTGEIRVNLGDSITGEGFDHNVPLWGTDGFVSRPADPDDKGAAQALYFADGNQKRVLATRDQRWSDKAGNLEPGDRAIVSNGPARVFVKRKSEAVTLYTENADQKPILAEVNGNKETITLLVVGGGGTSLLQMKPGQITLGVDGGGSIVIDKQGVHVFGPYFAANTGGGNLGTIAGVVPPPGPNSILQGPTGMAGIPNPKWTIGM